MAQTFFINKDSSMPYLRMMLTCNGRNFPHKANIALQNADVTFSMVNADTGVRKISNAKARIIDVTEGCEEKYVIEYRWNKRDTNEAGRFVGTFNISFSDNIVAEGMEFHSGELVAPIMEKLIIFVSDQNIKK